MRAESEGVSDAEAVGVPRGLPLALSAAVADAEPGALAVSDALGDGVALPRTVLLSTAVDVTVTEGDAVVEGDLEPDGVEEALRRSEPDCPSERLGGAERECEIVGAGDAVPLALLETVGEGGGEGELLCWPERLPDGELRAEREPACVGATEGVMVVEAQMLGVGSRGDADAASEADRSGDTEGDTLPVGEGLPVLERLGRALNESAAVRGAVLVAVLSGAEGEPLGEGDPEGEPHEDGAGDAVAVKEALPLEDGLARMDALREAVTQGVVVPLASRDGEVVAVGVASTLPLALPPLEGDSEGVPVETAVPERAAVPRGDADSLRLRAGVTLGETLSEMVAVEVGDAEALPLAEGGRLLRADAHPEGEADAHAEGENGADGEGNVEAEANSAVPEALSATETECVRDAGAVLEAQALSEDHREAVAPSVALPV